nr:hypothetical protein [Nocardia wallacei]
MPDSSAGTFKVLSPGFATPCEWAIGEKGWYVAEFRDYVSPGAPISAAVVLFSEVGDDFGVQTEVGADYRGAFLAAAKGRGVEGVDGSFVVLFAETVCQSLDLAASAVGEATAAIQAADDPGAVAVGFPMSCDEEFCGRCGHVGALHEVVAVRVVTVS